MSQAVKIVSPMIRRDGMSREEFQHHYIGRHTKLATGYEGQFKYVAHTAIRGANGEPAAFDAIGELWFENLEILRQEYDKPKWDDSRRDQPSMIAGRLMCIFSEVEVKAPPAPGVGVQYSAFLTRADKQTWQGFRRLWFDEHVPAALKIPGLLGYRACPGVVSAVGDSLLRLPGDATPFDGVAQMWFESVEAFDAAYRSAEWNQLWVDGYGEFAMRNVQFLTREHLVFDHTAKA